MYHKKRNGFKGGTEAAIKALENDLIEYFKTNEVEEVIGADLGDLSDYTKVTVYSVLRIK